ncbi:DUF397 domain-containing protein [Nocardia vinacea]|uniref:DUF397 domain-containing protein n=1 Tax=Nocardia vinacea TaxID=96468 RepID=A0ABZ1Z2Z5_9NOCA|nr:DUF397 domain-containing protein [Nocardia vinacea]
MSGSDFACTTGWFKSSWSSETQSCVEVKFDGDLVLIRDSKYLRDPANDPTAQPTIAVLAEDWNAFLRAANGMEPDAWRDLPIITRHGSGGVTVHAADGTMLTYTAAEWVAFVAGVRDGEFAAA